MSDIDMIAIGTMIDIMSDILIAIGDWVIQWLYSDRYNE